MVPVLFARLRKSINCKEWYLLLKNIHTSTRKIIRVSITEHMTNPRTGNDFHTTTTLPCSEGYFWINIKILKLVILLHVMLYISHICSQSHDFTYRGFHHPRHPSSCRTCPVFQTTLYLLRTALLLLLGT